jgi:hypothetical protein
VRTVVTLEGLTEALIQDREAARVAREHGAAISATKALIDLHGFKVDPRENRRSPFEDMSDEELDTVIETAQREIEGLLEGLGDNPDTVDWPIHMPIKYDPKPLEEMTPIERRDYVRMLREEARHSQPDPDDNSSELILEMLEERATHPSQSMPFEPQEQLDGPAPADYSLSGSAGVTCDSMPLSEMTPAEKKALARKLREQAKHPMPDPRDAADPLPMK